MSQIIKEDEFITRDDLRDYIHGIHNFIRNNGAGYGQTGVKIFSVFYGLKLIQPYLEKFGFTKDQQNKLDFNVLVKMAIKAKKEFDTTNGMTGYIDNVVLEELWTLRCNRNDPNHNLGHFIFHQIPKDLKDTVWTELILKINKIPVGYKKERKVNLSGKVWEYFVGRDSTAISELGAYFSDRHITEFTFNKIKPKLIDGNVPLMIDPFAGSGGFTLGYANYMREHYTDIEWSTNVDNIYHFDMEESVVNMSGLEMFAITGYFPKRSLGCNFTRVNTFTSEFACRGNKPNKFYYIFANPPYGGDKVNKNAEQIKRDKLIDYIKNINDRTEELNEQLKDLVKTSNDYKKDQESHQVKLNTCSRRIRDFAKKYNIDTANDKEACSLILLMDMLEVGGTCCAILKEGVFFDGKYSKLRKVLVDNFNITDIISVPQNAFENTSTKTSIIIFHNNGQTKTINFSELNVLVEENDVFDIVNGRVVMIKIKDEINKVVENQLCVATYNQIAIQNKTKFDYSLNYKNYKEYHVVCPEGYELKRLSDICEINPNKNNKKEKENTIFKYIEISDIDSNQIINSTELKFKDMPKGTKHYPIINDILICSVRPNINKIVFLESTKYYDNMLLSSAIYNLRFNNNYMAVYTYNYIISILDSYLKEIGNGSTYPRISPKQLEDIQIPIPKDINKLKEPLESLQKLHEQITHDTELIPIKEKTICNLIKELTNGNSDNYDSHKIGDISKLIDGYDFYKSDMDSDKILKPNINLPIIKNNGGVMCDYVKINNKFNKYIAIKNDILISTAGTCGRVIKLQFEKGYHAHHMPRFVDIKINKEYLYYYILLSFDDNFIKNNTSGSVLGHLKMKTILESTINVLKPSIMEQYKLLEMFDEVNQLKETLENNKLEYKKQIDTLFEEFKNNNEESINEAINEKPINEEPINEESINEEPINEESINEELINEEPINEEHKKSSKKISKKKQIKTIEYKNKTYILEDTQVYKINENNKKGKLYGTFIDGKIKKL